MHAFHYIFFYLSSVQLISRKIIILSLYRSMLSNNKIMSVSHGSLPSNLVTLELRANPLRTVHESAIRNLKRLKKLYVHTHQSLLDIALYKLSKL